MTKCRTILGSYYSIGSSPRCICHRDVAYLDFRMGNWNFADTSGQPIRACNPPQQQIKPHYCLLQGPRHRISNSINCRSEQNASSITQRRKNRRATDSKRPVSSFLVASIRSHTRSSSNVERRRRRLWPFDNDDSDDHELSEPCQLPKQLFVAS